MADARACYPILRFDLARDCFVIWVRWVAMEKPPSPEEPPGQGVRVELMLNRNSVLGPTIVYRRDLERPVYLRANTARTRDVVRTAASASGTVDIQLVIHGSVANAPYAALYQVRDYDGDAIDTRRIDATPLLQVQPSTPADRWHVAAQANLRVTLDVIGDPLRLKVLN